MKQYILFQQDIGTPVPPPIPPSGMAPPPPPPPVSMQPGGSASGMAITALVLGIISYFICPMIGGIAAWIVGKMELNKIDRGESSAAGKGMAKVGMWLGIINVILNILAGIALIIYFVFLAAIIGSSHSY
ncbi:MAG: DUF4190 domain-containing protein [Ignavibacteria bacterium]|jgi:hypothetical protein